MPKRFENIFEKNPTLLGYLNQDGLVSVCSKFQLPSLSRSGLKVGGSGACDELDRANPSLFKIIQKKVGIWELSLKREKIESLQ